MNEAPPRFRPLAHAPRPRRIAAALIGPLLWLLAFAILAVVAHETSAIAHGLAVATVSYAVAIAVLIPMRRARIREEAQGEPGPGG